MKVKAWGVEQVVIGADWKRKVWFDNKEARDEFYNAAEYVDKLRCRMVDTDEVDVYHTLSDFREAVRNGLA